MIINWDHKHHVQEWTGEQWEDVVMSHSHVFGYRTHKHELTTTGDSHGTRELWSEAFDIQTPRSETLAVKLQGIDL